ncbi:MAG: restriction endonuclease, partial [Phycisphaerales bacterium]|nr:restriction endonuclease [Phycisphaerales bacterium]
MELEKRVGQAIRHFWKVRAHQLDTQGTNSGRKDYGTRGAVTGGKHLDGFIDLLADVLAEAGLPHTSIHTSNTTLPGFFRPTKNWDLVVVADGQLLASIEFKAQVGSFGNNFNNRVEE